MVPLPINRRLQEARRITMPEADSLLARLIRAGELTASTAAIKADPDGLRSSQHQRMRGQMFLPEHTKGSWHEWHCRLWRRELGRGSGGAATWARRRRGEEAIAQRLGLAGRAGAQGRRHE